MTDQTPDDQSTEPELTASQYMDQLIRSQPARWNPFPTTTEPATDTEETKP